MRYCLMFVIVLLPAVCVGQMSTMETNLQGIAVSGVGEAMARPNVAEMELTIAGSAEIYGDALVKFRDAKRRTTEALNNLGLKNLSLEEKGLTLARGDTQEMMNRAMRGDVSASAKPKVELSTRLRARLADIQNAPPEEVLELVGKLVDTSRDAGNDIGPSQADINMSYRYGRQVNNALVRFVLENFDEHREKAYEAAMNDARSRAARLARLSGLELGGIESVRELSVAGENPSSDTNYVNSNPTQSVDTTRVGSRITTDTFTEIPVRVRLYVRFSTRPTGDQLGQK